MDSFVHRWRGAAALAATVLLLACGDKPAVDKPATAAAAPATAAVKLARKDGLPPPRCPVRAAADAAAPDVGGLRLGLPAADALDLVRCAHPDAVASTEKKWIQQLQSHGIELAPQTVTLRIGEAEPCDFRKSRDIQHCARDGMNWTFEAETVELGLPGLPGRETLMGVWRAQRFKPGQGPATDAVLQALRDKYGAPQRSDRLRNGSIELHWARDLQGRPLSAQQAAALQCPLLVPYVDKSRTWAEGCGLTLAAAVVPAPDNPLLVREVHVGMLNQQQLFAFGQTLQAELNRLEQQRRAAQAERAASQAVKL